jgi:DTW domain-containing protein YfiP
MPSPAPAFGPDAPDPVVFGWPGNPRRRSGPVPRCARCALHVSLCLCPELEPQPTALRVVVVATEREARQSTNTGRLVPLLLAGARLHVRGRDVPLRAEDLSEPGRRSLLLFPGRGSRELAPGDDPAAFTLIVPDGTWRATRRLTAREPALAGLERVHLPPGPPTRYRLRSHPDGSCLATLEAVARAVGRVESRATQAALEEALARFVDRTLWSRGQLRAHAVRGGLPAGT